MSIWEATVRVIGPGAPSGVADGRTVRVVVDDMVGGKFGAEGSGWETREEALGALLALERRQVVRLEGMTDSAGLADLRDLLDRLAVLLAEDPGLHNVVGDHRAWAEEPEHYDYVEAASDLGRLKRLERDLYLSHLAPFLDALPEGARILDAGCGPGRFVSHLLRRGFRVHLVDAAPDALHRALAHGLDAGGTGDTLDGLVGDVDSLDAFEDAAFDAVLAMEVICYRGDPLATLRELVRVTRPGGLVMLSVEGLYGALLASQAAEPGQVLEALETGRSSAPRDVHVTYFTAQSLQELVEAAGLVAELIEGCHYVCEGPFGHVVDVTRLDDETHRRSVLDLEAACAADPLLEPLARAWLAVGRRNFG